MSRSAAARCVFVCACLPESYQHAGMWPGLHSMECMTAVLQECARADISLHYTEVHALMSLTGHNTTGRHPECWHACPGVCPGQPAPAGACVAQVGDNLRVSAPLFAHVRTS
jgi:hypothetical protein